MGVKKKAGQSSRLKDLQSNALLNKALIVLAVVVGIFVVLFASRSWLRVTVVPKTVAVFHSGSVQKVAKTEIANFGDAAGFLKLDDAKAEKSCKLIAAKGIKEEVICTYSIHDTIVFPSQEAEAAPLVSGAQQLQKILESNGWSGTFAEDAETASLVRLVEGISKNIDYTPDAFYSKTVGDITCIFDSNVAFKIPENPTKQMSYTFNCSRTVKVFGAVLPLLNDDDGSGMQLVPGPIDASQVE